MLMGTIPLTADILWVFIHHPPNCFIKETVRVCVKISHLSSPLLLRFLHTEAPIDLSWTSFWSPYKDTAPHWSRSTGEMCARARVIGKAGFDPSYYNLVRRFRFSVYVYICACVFMRRFNIAHWMSIFHVVLDYFLCEEATQLLKTTDVAAKKC